MREGDLVITTRELHVYEGLAVRQHLENRGFKVHSVTGAKFGLYEEQSSLLISIPTGTLGTVCDGEMFEGQFVHFHISNELTRELDHKVVGLCLGKEIRLIPALECLAMVSE